MPRQLYAMKEKGCVDFTGFHAVDIERANKLNKEGWGIHKSVNSFPSTDRKSQNCDKIEYWAVDIDAGTKEDQINNICQGIEPTLIVETYRGHHLYFASINGKKENYSYILEKYLIPFYNADKQAKDISRVLREPFFQQWKYGDPFLVKPIYSSNRRYTERQIKDFFESFQDKESIEPIVQKKSGRVFTFARQYSITANQIGEALGGRKIGNNYWICRCPAHADNHPSFVVNEKEGKPLVYCMAGCSQESVIDALKNRGLW